MISITADNIHNFSLEEYKKLGANKYRDELTEKIKNESSFEMLSLLSENEELNNNISINSLNQKIINSDDQENLLINNITFLFHQHLCHLNKILKNNSIKDIYAIIEIDRVSSHNIKVRNIFNPKLEITIDLRDYNIEPIYLGKMLLIKIDNTNNSILYVEPQIENFNVINKKIRMAVRKFIKVPELLFLVTFDDLLSQEKIDLLSKTNQDLKLDFIVIGSSAVNLDSNLSITKNYKKIFLDFQNPIYISHMGLNLPIVFCPIKLDPTIFGDKSESNFKKLINEIVCQETLFPGFYLSGSCNGVPEKNISNYTFNPENTCIIICPSVTNEKYIYSDNFVSIVGINKPSVIKIEKASSNSFIDRIKIL